MRKDRDCFTGVRQEEKFAMTNYCVHTKGRRMSILLFRSFFTNTFGNEPYFLCFSEGERVHPLHFVPSYFRENKILSVKFYNYCINRVWV